MIPNPASPKHLKTELTSTGLHGTTPLSKIIHTQKCLKEQTRSDSMPVVQLSYFAHLPFLCSTAQDSKAHKDLNKFVSFHRFQLWGHYYSNKIIK